jgi:hypothetical protein
MADHPQVFTKDGKLAVVAHLYSADPIELERYAEESHLRLEVPDFPDWHYPNWCTLVIWHETPAARAVGNKRFSDETLAFG